MAKVRQRKQPISPATKHAIPQNQMPTMQVSLGFDPTGKIEQKDIVGSKDGWSEYTLDDGSVIRAKAVVLDVKRAVDQYSLDGNPLYIVQFAFVNQVQAPDKLKRKVGK